MTKQPSKTYAELKSELDDVMAQLVDENLDVDKALVLYQKGIDLVAAIELYLKTAKNTVHELKAKLKTSK